MTELKPCAFCGSSSAKPDFEGNEWIECRSCCAQGPLHDTLNAAREAWNARPIEDALRAALNEFARFVQNVHGFLYNEGWETEQKEAIALLAKYGYLAYATLDTAPSPVPTS